MKYPNEGRRKARKAAREAAAASLGSDIDTLINKAFPIRTQEQTDLLRIVIRQFHTDFNRLPAEMELLRILVGIVDHFHLKENPSG